MNWYTVAMNLTPVRLIADRAAMSDNTTEAVVNWYNLLKTAGRFPTRVYTDPNNKWFAVGNSFPIKDQLRSLGFRWDGANREWRIPMQAVETNPSVKAGLQQVGVTVAPAAPASPAAPGAAPGAPSPAPAQPAPGAGNFVLTRTGRIMPKGQVPANVYEQFMRPMGFAAWRPNPREMVYLSTKDTFLNNVQNPEMAPFLMGLRGAGWDAYAMAQSLGVQVQPPAETPQQQQPADQQQQQQIKPDTYFLAMRVADRKPFVARESKGVGQMASMVSFESVPELPQTKDEKVEQGVVVPAQGEQPAEKGNLTLPEFTTQFQIVKGPKGQKVESMDPEEVARQGQAYATDDQRMAKLRAKHVLPVEKMNEEGQGIDARFQQMAADGQNSSHMMINALAGSGKTTMLKHLAWKYGRPGDKFLYLVFNSKNRIEAMEKFPPWVTVKTTNAFLGDVLDKHNVGNLESGSTRRMKSIENQRRNGNGNGGEDNAGGVPDKIRFLADTKPFAAMMQKVGIREMKPQEIQYVNQQNANMAQGKFGERVASFIERTIEYVFKDESIKLAELCKAYALDPRDAAFDQKLMGVASQYDIGFTMPDAKEHVAKWSDSYRTPFLGALSQVLGYDFMSKSYQPEMMAAAKWLVQQSLPGATAEKYRHSDGSTHELGQYRDFTDDLWLPAILADKMVWPHYDYVLADEVQDFNECQSIMLKKLAQAGAKIVAVGDPNQSIYRFRGADSNSFGRVGQMLTGISADKNVVQSLSRNFRSRPAILNYVNDKTHVKNLKQGKQFNDGNEGEVTEGQHDEHTMMSQIAQEWQTGQMPETAILSRTNEPLAESALQLLAAGVPFVIVGKDVAKDLTNHVKKIIRLTGGGGGGQSGLDAKMQRTHIREFVDRMIDHTDKEVYRYGRSAAKKGYLQELTDRTSAVEACAGQFIDDRTFPDKNTLNFIKWVTMRLKGLNIEDSAKDYAEYKSKMESERPPVTLTTAHRSKGLEFGRVFVLRPELFPHPKSTRDEDLAQEENARYVSYTRAMDQLHILKPKKKPGEDDGM